MEYISSEIINEAIENLEIEFDSHDLISWIMENKPQEYIDELYCNYRRYEEPFKQLHAVIGKTLSQNNNIKPKGKTVSNNLFNNKNSNEKWEKNVIPK